MVKQVIYKNQAKPERDLRYGGDREMMSVNQGRGVSY